MNILYTGARSGIAYSVIKKFKNDKKYFLYLGVHTDNELKRVKKLYNDYNNVKCLKLDITNKEDLKQIEKLDIDILVSNAAIGYGGSICDIEIDKMKENFEVNVFSNVNLIQIVLKKMIKKNKGKIIIMSSLAGLIPISFLGSYCATKASLIKIGECLKKEIKMLNKNIDIVLIEPGLYKTGFNKYMFDNKDTLLEQGYFNEIINYIKLKDNLILLFEKKSLNSISNKIYKSIIDTKPKFIYRAPFLQVFFAKLYMLFFE